MNVFIIIIVFLFMAGWYLMGSPSQNIQEHSIEYAERKTAINSVLTCIAHIHAEAVQLDDALGIDQNAMIDNDAPCAEKYEALTVKVCADDRRVLANCVPARVGQAINNYVITTAPPPMGGDLGKVLELLSDEYSSNSNFGVLVAEGKKLWVVTGGGKKREVSAAVAKEAGLQAGHFVYMTQYSVAGKPAFSSGKATDYINCVGGEIKVFRFGRWQCVPQTAAVVCSGATIWDPDKGACVSDQSRRPLCGMNQTAVMVDDNWECMDPFVQKDCPSGQSPHLDYVSMEWVCQINPAESKAVKKCENILRGRMVAGGTLRTSIASSCNDCEEMVIDSETCESACVPVAARARNKLCYAGECNGARKAFYFGFPDAAYTAAARKVIPELMAVEIRMDAAHSQNRKFNCLDCGEGYVDTEKSASPWTAVCK